MDRMGRIESEKIRRFTRRSPVKTTGARKDHGCR